MTLNILYKGIDRIAVIKYILGIISASIAIYVWVEFINLLANSGVGFLQIIAFLLSYWSPIGWVFFSGLGFGIYFLFAFFLNLILGKNKEKRAG